MQKDYKKPKYSKPTMEKEVSQYVHAKMRMREHFGICLTKKLYNEIIDAISKKKDTETIKVAFKRKQSVRVIIFIVTLTEYNIDCEVCYDSKRKSLATIMPVREGRFYPYYLDCFGNKVNVYNERNCSSIQLDDNGDVVNFGDTLIRIGERIYKFDDINLYLELGEDDVFQQVYIME